MLVATSFDSTAYAITAAPTYENVERFVMHCAKFQQSTAAQLRCWVNPSLDPDSPESRSVAGVALDDGLYPIAHKICEIRVSKNGMAIADSFTGLQSILRNAFPILKGKGGGVSVRYAEIRPDGNGDFAKTTITNTKAFAGAKSAEWSRIGDDGTLRVARIAWKQAVTTDILDKVEDVAAVPGGENIGIVHAAGDNDAVMPQHGQENGNREPGYTQAYVEEVVQKAVTRDRKNRRVRLEERDLLAMIQNCHGEIAMAIRVATMKRFGLIEPIAIPHVAPVPSGKRNRVLPEHVIS